MTAPLLTAAEVGELLQVPPSWVLREARAGAIPHVRLGKYVRFEPAEIAAWRDHLRQGPKGHRVRA